MTALGLGAAWAAYTVGIWGYCLVRGYNVTFTSLMAGSWTSYGGGVIPGTPSAGASGAGEIGGSTFT